jgi:DNA-binding IclR family transcriptional regulator
MIQSVDRALRILGVLQGARRLSLGDLAARLDLPPSTVHGIVRTLVAHGMVTQERDSGRYRLGPAVLRMGNVYLDTLELRSRVTTWADELAARSGFAVRTGVLLLDDVVIIHHVPRPDGSRQMPEVGIVIPAHASALGKAMLSVDDATAAQVISSGAVRRSMTGDTVTDPDRLRELLADIRRTGVADEREESVLGECGLASPVLDEAGFLAGAVGVVVPSSEWPVEPAVVEAVRTTARTVSKELGAPYWPVPPT